MATRLSTVHLTYAVMKSAVEATLSIEVLRGDFYGEITAWTSSVTNTLKLHDSKLLAGVVTVDGKRVIQLLQSVVSVYLKERLLLIIVAGTADGGETERTICFTPRVNGGVEHEVDVGLSTLRLKVIWSRIDY